MVLGLGWLLATLPDSGCKLMLAVWSAWWVLQLKEKPSVGWATNRTAPLPGMPMVFVWDSARNAPHWVKMEMFGQPKRASPTLAYLLALHQANAVPATAHNGGSNPKWLEVTWKPATKDTGRVAIFNHDWGCAEGLYPMSGPNQRWVV